MHIADLQTTLHAHADALLDEGMAGRAAAARHQARTIRVRRIAVTATAAVVVLPIAGAAMLGVNPLRRSEPPIDVPEKDPGVVATFAGRTLLDSEVVRDGAALTLTFDSDSPTQWTASCFGVDGTYVVHASLDGGSPGESLCEREEPPEPLMGYVLDSRFEPGSHTMRLWLTDSGGTEVGTVPGSVLAAGVYELPEPVAVVAGVDVYELEEAFTQEWTYVASHQSQAGERSLVSTHDAGSRLLPRLIATDVDPGQVALLVDGVKADAAAVLNGSGYLEPLRGGSHTIVLQVESDVAPTARLGVIWRTPAS